MFGTWAEGNQMRANASSAPRSSCLAAIEGDEDPDEREPRERWRSDDATVEELAADTPVSLRALIN